MVAAGLTACCLLALPSQAVGHGGEVHTEEPAAVTKPSKATPKPEARVSGKPAERKMAAGAAREPEETIRVASEVPPPPAQPESDPTLHFIALAVVAVLGGGFLLIRRRRDAV